MNLVKELETILKQPNFMGESDKTGVNLAVNAILDKIDELGFDIVEKEIKENPCENCDRKNHNSYDICGACEFAN